MENNFQIGSKVRLKNDIPNSPIKKDDEGIVIAVKQDNDDIFLDVRFSTNSGLRRHSSIYDHEVELLV